MWTKVSIDLLFHAVGRAQMCADLTAIVRPSSRASADLVFGNVKVVHADKCLARQVVGMAGVPYTWFCLCTSAPSNEFFTQSCLNLELLHRVSAQLQLVEQLEVSGQVGAQAQCSSSASCWLQMPFLAESARTAVVSCNGTFDSTARGPRIFEQKGTYLNVAIESFAPSSHNICFSLGS